MANRSPTAAVTGPSPPPPPPPRRQGPSRAPPYSLEKAALVLVLLEVAELDLALDAGELARLLLGDGVRAVQNGVPRLPTTQETDVSRPDALQIMIFGISGIIASMYLSCRDDYL